MVSKNLLFSLNGNNLKNEWIIKENTYHPKPKVGPPKISKKMRKTCWSPLNFRKFFYFFSENYRKNEGISHDFGLKFQKKSKSFIKFCRNRSKNSQKFHQRVGWVWKTSVHHSTIAKIPKKSDKKSKKPCSRCLTTSVNFVTVLCIIFEAF